VKNKLLDSSFSLRHFRLRLQVALQVPTFCVLASAGSQCNGPLLSHFHVEIETFKGDETCGLSLLKSYKIYYHSDEN
jgi:hypothetical protein